VGGVVSVFEVNQGSTMNLNLATLGGTVLSRRPEMVAPDRADVEAAFRTIIRWAGDDPSRSGLIETPSRMARAFEEYFAGYGEDPALMLQKTFEEIGGYDEMIVLGGVRLSHCEHHLAPMVGRMGRLCAERPRGGHQPRARSRGLREASANSGKNDGANRECHL
jgi:hypothetical protein